MNYVMTKYHLNIQCCVNHDSIVCVMYTCLNNAKGWEECDVILSPVSNIVHNTCAHEPGSVWQVTGALYPGH